MGLFSTTKPIITQNEAKEMENRLYSEHGFSQKKIAIVREMIKPHLSDAENYGDPVGVSPAEVKQIDETLEDRHQVLSSQLTEPERAAVEKLMEDYLKLRK